MIHAPRRGAGHSGARPGGCAPLRSCPPATFIRASSAKAPGSYSTDNSGEPPRDRVGIDRAWDGSHPDGFPARSLALRSLRPFVAIPFRAHLDPAPEAKSSGARLFAEHQPQRVAWGRGVRVCQPLWAGVTAAVGLRHSRAPGAVSSCALPFRSSRFRLGRPAARRLVAAFALGFRSSPSSPRCRCCPRSFPRAS